MLEILRYLCFYQTCWFKFYSLPIYLIVGVSCRQPGDEAAAHDLQAQHRPRGPVPQRGPVHPEVKSRVFS